METKQQQTQDKPPRNHRPLKIALLVLLAIIVVIGGRLVYVMFFDPQSAFEKPPTSTPAIPTVSPGAPQHTNAPDVPTPSPSPTLSPEEELRLQADLSFMKNKVNILFLGWDQSPERSEEGSAVFRDEDNNYRSDVIMLLTVDFETKTVDLISVPRDTYAPIYNTKGRWKINAAFAKGGSAEGEGFTYAMNTVSNLLGVPIDYYAGVDMIGLKAVVDAMGGVDYDVDVEIKLNGRVLEKGYQHLDGQQVLDYCRARKGISTDVGRADRQQRILFAIFAQLKTRNQLTNLPKIYLSVQDKVKTNLNMEQIAALSVFALSLEMENLGRHTLAGEYISNVYNASYYVLDNRALETLINQVFGIEIKTNPRYGLPYVKADKAAQNSLSYADGAQYLLSAFASSGRAAGAKELRAELAALNALVPEDVSVFDTESTRATALNEAEITKQQERVAAAMYTLCVRNGITQGKLDKSRLPAAFFARVPLTSSVTQPSEGSGGYVNPSDRFGD